MPKQYVSFLLFWGVVILVGSLSVMSFLSYQSLYRSHCEVVAPLSTVADFLLHDSSEFDDEFCVVNRAADYLRDEALAFAPETLRGSIIDLYEPKDIADVLKEQDKKRKNKRRSKRAQSTSSYWNAWNKHKIELRFLLPIEKNKFWISSPFGRRKSANGKMGFHHGVDMAANHGTPVRAAGDGVVMQAHYAGGYGNVIVIKHDKKFRTRYAHLSALTVRKGQVVKAGQLIGRVGATGYVRGKDASHLHFEVEVYGKRVNPFCFLKC